MNILAGFNVYKNKHALEKQKCAVRFKATANFKKIHSKQQNC